MWVLSPTCYLRELCRPEFSVMPQAAQRWHVKSKAQTRPLAWTFSLSWYLKKCSLSRRIPSIRTRITTFFKQNFSPYLLVEKWYMILRLNVIADYTIKLLNKKSLIWNSDAKTLWNVQTVYAAWSINDLYKINFI